MESKDILEILSPRQKEIILLRNDGYSYKEIAEKLNISVTNARKIKERAKKIALSVTNEPNNVYITIMDKKALEYYLKEIDPDLKKKAYVFMEEWDIKGMDWEDLAQELRIHLMNKYDSFNPEKSSFRTWANRIMLNKIKNIAREKNLSADVINRKSTLSIEELKEKGFDV